MADDEELLSLAAQAGCTGVFIGFESVTAEGLKALGGKRPLLEGRGCGHRPGDGDVRWGFLLPVEHLAPGMAQSLATAQALYDAGKQSLLSRQSAYKSLGLPGLSTVPRPMRSDLRLV